MVASASSVTMAGTGRARDQMYALAAESPPDTSKRSVLVVIRGAEGFPVMLEGTGNTTRLRGATAAIQPAETEAVHAAVDVEVDDV